MEKNLDEMSEQELLRELLKRQSRQQIIGWIAAGGVLLLALVLLVSAVTLVPKLVATLDQTYSTMEQAYATLDETRGIITQAQTELAAVDGFVKAAADTLQDIDFVVDNISTLVITNTEGLQNALDKLNAIDIEKLNKSIDDLSKIIAPLSKLFSLGRS